MAEISKITLPTGSVYDIKDATARAAIANLQNTENILSTDAASTPYGVQWTDGGTTITGTLIASAETVKKIYLVPNNSSESDNIYDEYLTLKINNNYNWEKIGSTKVDISGLGELAYKDTATTSYTPSGSVEQPTFSGNLLTSTGNTTPSGSVTVTTATTTSKIAVVSSASGSATYTPDGTITAPEITIAAAGSTASVNSLSSYGTLPSFSATVSNENLSLGFSSGSLPSGSPITVKTSDATYEASSPTFVGIGTRLVTESIAIPNTYNATFSGIQNNIQVSGTPSGTVSKPSFVGDAATITVS